MDRTSSRNRYGEEAKYNHPLVQTIGMFVGMSLAYFGVLLENKRQRGGVCNGERTGLGTGWVAIPALLDLVGTVGLMIGLTLTHPSDFQMLRSSTVVFTTLFAWMFRGQRPTVRKALGVLIVIAGLVLVGTSPYVCHSKLDTASNPVVGNAIVVLSMVVLSSQFVFEERLLHGLEISPMKTAAWEGIFGLAFSMVLAVIAYYVPKPSLLQTPGAHDADAGHFEDGIDALVQWGHNRLLVVYSVLSMVCCGTLNLCSLIITSRLSAGSRVILDSVRSIIVWGFALAMGWEQFCWVQVLGFAALVCGALVYHDIQLCAACQCLRASLRREGLSAQLLVNAEMTEAGEGA